MFFGREGVFSWIEQSLGGKYVDHILVLHGQRRVGKTSVLKQIPNFLPDKYIQVFFDLQGRTGTTIDRFLWWLASEIVRTLKKERGITLPKPDRKAFKDTEYLINEFLPSLRPILGKQVLLLTFDEFDTLDRPEIQEKLAKPLISYLRRLIEMDGLSFIFSIGSSGDKLENMQASYTDFFKSALYRKISFLPHDDCHRLITKPVEDVIKYDKKAVTQIAEISSGHPYFAQLICHELFSLCQKTGAREISAKDVEDVLEDVIERGTVNLKFVWDEASDLEKWILAALAKKDGGDKQELAQVLREQRVRFSDPDLNSSIIHLRDKDVLTKDNRFVIHLMRMWLVATRPMDRVREELVEVNPIANRYIEIGDEYRDRGQNQPAIDSYQQALNADPENLKAQINIALVYLEREDYPEAVAAFEEALKIDDEDVVARTGYCDAHLALGDVAQSRGETDEAISLFQTILVLNPAHTDARQRLAKIYRKQAEDLLDAGKDDKALSTFDQAIMFTPDDDDLSARYEEVLTEKKSKVINTWLSKAEKALSRRRWDDAAEMVAEAVKIDPDNQELKTKLAEVKDALRQFKLQGCRREAEQALARGNWDKAIAAIETALQLAPEDLSWVDWLNTVRADQLNEQLDLYAQQAEKAVEGKDWDIAIQAAQSAIKLAPKDKKWQTRLDEIERARHQAQLAALQAKANEARKNSFWDKAIRALEELLKLEDSEDVRAEIESIRKEKRDSELAVFRSQAEKAVIAKNWNVAIQAVQNAMKLAPKEENWQVRLDEIEHARHQAQLDALQTKANEARRNRHWDEAISILEELLKLENSAHIRAEIEDIQKEKRDSELLAFRSQAEKATEIENWDEAAQAWEAYLALNPNDGASIESKLQHTRKYAKIAGDYTEAQQSIRKKRYGRAIELLQGVIAQDPTYKSTSRLLVEAVESNKAIPVWRRSWMYWALGIVGVVALGIFFGPGLFTKFSLSAPMVTEEIIEATSTVAPLLTSTPLPTETSINFNVAVTTVLTYVNEHSPTFEDNFSISREDWGFTSEEYIIDNPLLGRFFKVSDAIQGSNELLLDNGLSGFSFPANGLFDATNFWLEFDCNLTPDDQQLDEMGIIFRAAQDHSEYYNFKFVNNDSAWGWELVQQEANGKFSSLASGGIDISSDSIFNNFLIVVIENNLLFLMNDTLIYSTENIALRGDTNLFFEAGSDTAYALLDNVKFWNLEGLVFGAQEDVSVNELDPVIQTYLVEHEPTFEDDFSAASQVWNSLAQDPHLANYEIVGQVLQLELQKGDVEPYAEVFLGMDFLKATDFGIEFEYLVVEADSNFRTVIGIDYYEDVKDLYVEIDAISGELQGSKIEHTGQPVTEAGVSGKWTKMRLVAVDGFFSVYVNDTPVAYYEDDTNAGLINRIKVFTLGKRVLVDIDNIKFWNLDGVNINP